MLIGPNNVALSQSLCFGFKATCNQAKYKALLAGLRVLAKEVEARRVRCRSFSSPLLKCLNKEHADYVITKLHEDNCGLHSGERSMATRALRVRISPLASTSHALL
ncbi:hypothetical protein JHK84_050170 [Glycine max]|uniref:RNase H type-1 domain-containing protein n=1 Tax=Glycine max TaxID=3847 RepID=A0A0R0EZT2_SOYBN|nr:hypothetical protein JHK84_050170 [Glycine max]KAH1154399.1 hypothetical protein GYH30_049900 [Glycine max]